MTGERLLHLFVLCLMIGGATTKIFFPEMLGAGLTPTTLLILIPIWSLGGVGLLLWIVGWLQHQYRIRASLDRQMPE
jgi:type IV secretory pathway TrbD component